jgi:malate dehydrogenase (oxaloacetate-decarboxylating)(NADP+)
MFVVAARAVADQVNQPQLDSGSLYPPQSNILQTEIAVAVKVAETIFAQGLAGAEKPASVRKFVEAQLYTPEYVSLGSGDLGR